MKKLELWIGRVEILTPPTDSEDTKAFTNVVTWASNLQEFKAMIVHVFEKYGFSLLAVEECGPVALRSGFDEEFEEVIARARDNLNACIYTTFYYYPSKAN